MATIDDLCISITEMPFDDAMKRIMICRQARRAALTEAFEKRKEASEKKQAKTKTKSKKPAKQLSMDDLFNVLNPEQKAALLKELTGA